MAETALADTILSELKVIRKDLSYIKEHMVDMDFLLSPDEAERLGESIKEHEAGKSVSLEDFEKERNR